MVSVIIAAHDEESVIGACLASLRSQRGGPQPEIIVSANGCTDRTAQIAAEAGVRVIDRSEPGKPGALNAADAVAIGFPRVYLDADIVLAPDALERVLRAARRLPRHPRRRTPATGRHAGPDSSRPGVLRDQRAFAGLPGRSVRPRDDRVVRGGSLQVHRVPADGRGRPVPRLALLRRREGPGGRGRGRRRGAVPHAGPAPAPGPGPAGQRPDAGGGRRRAGATGSGHRTDGRGCARSSCRSRGWPLPPSRTS